MTLKSYLWIMALSTLMSFAAWGLIIFYIDPEDTNLIGFVLFFASLFFGMAGFFTLAGFYLRLWKSKKQIIFAHVGPAFRQGILIALAVTFCLVLQSLRMLTFWNAFLLVGALALLEFYFMSR